MKKILVVRNDKIGDFMLAWPSFAMLKQSLPDSEITALVPAYTKDLALLCPWIDKVIVDCSKRADKAAKRALISQIKAEQFDASICLFSDTYNATLVWKARIPYRLAPATKFAQVLYNRRLKQRRSRSEKPEFEYNLDLIRFFLEDNRVNAIEPSAPYLSFSEQIIANQRSKLIGLLGLKAQQPWYFVHAGSGGSANNLSLSQYAELISGIAAVNPECQFVLTAGPGESEQAYELRGLIGDTISAMVYDSNDGLPDFTCSLACADAFLAGSTGPLHIAATVDVPTVGFFPSKRSATPLRWKTINSEGRHLAFAPPAEKESADDLSFIQVAEILPAVNTFLQR